MIVTAVAIVVANGVGLLLLRYFDAFDLRIVERFLPCQKWCAGAGFSHDAEFMRRRARVETVECDLIFWKDYWK